MIPKVLVVSTAGVASAGGIGAGYMLSGNKEITSISKRIKKQGERFILSSSENVHDAQGESLVQTYTPLITTNPNKKPLIKEFSNKVPSKDELKKWCRDNSGENHELKEKFDAFREGCTQDNIQQHIKVASSINKIPLALGDSEGENRKTSYNSSATDQNQITDASGTAIVKTKLQDVKILQEWCFKNAKGLYTDENDKIFKAYKEGCIKDK